MPLNYGPILVCSDIKSCIFGINPENKFDKVKRFNNISFILFKTKSSLILKLKMYCEKAFASSFAKVMLIAVINENRRSFIKAKTKSLARKEWKDQHFLLENLSEDESEFADIYFNHINLKNLKYQFKNFLNVIKSLNVALIWAS